MGLIGVVWVWFTDKRPTIRDGGGGSACEEWAQQDSNLRPPGYEPGALPTEL